MFGILSSAFAVFTGFLLRKVVFTLLIGTILFWVVTGFVPILVAQVFPDTAAAGSNLSSAFAGLSPEMWYFLDMFALSTGFPLVLSAYVARFITRRIPWIG